MPVARPDHVPSRTVRTARPVEDWEDALITGNGSTGALVHSTHDRIRVTLSHERLFLPVTAPLPAPHTAPLLAELRSMIRAGRAEATAERIVAAAAAEHPGYSRTRWIDPLVGAALLSLRLRSPRPGNLHRTCDLDSGLVSEYLPGKIVHRVFASRTDDAVLVEVHAPEGLDALLSLSLLEEDPPVPITSTTEVTPDLLGLRVGFPERPSGTIPGHTVDCDVDVEGGSVRKVGDGLELLGVARLLLALRVRVARPDQDAPPPTGSTGLLRSGPGTDPGPKTHTLAPLLDRHRAEHGALMDRFRLRLGGVVPNARRSEELLAEGAGPELVTRLVDAGRYAIVSSCGELPPTLQGVWSGTYDPPWRSGYTFDGNLPSAVAALHTTGTPELMDALFDLIDDYADDLTENARRLYGCRGVLVPPHASTHGRHNHFGPVWCLTCWTSGAAWMARLYWDHFSHTRDRDFLRDRALPFLTAAAEFHEDFLTEEGFNPSYSPENTPADTDGQVCVNATMDVAAARDLLRNLVRAHRILRLPGARRWVRSASRLPGYRIGEGGVLAEWATPTGRGGAEQRDQHAHRHASHLFPLWYESDPALASPPLRDAAVRAVRARLAWWRGQEADEMAFGLCQLGLAAARLGMAEEAHETLALMATRYWRPTLVPTHNRNALFNVDIGGGFPAVVTAMLAGSTEGRLDLLPALPSHWREGSVRGLRARGGVVVDLLTWEGGTAVAHVRSVEPRTLWVGLPDGTRRQLRTGPDKADTLQFSTISDTGCRSASKFLC